MRNSDGGPGRIAALVALVVLSAAALRGYVPGREGGRSEPMIGDRASLAGVVALLAVSITIVGIAVVNSMLHRDRAPKPAAAALPESLGSDGHRLRWRVLLIGLAVMVAWVLLVLMLSQWIGPQGIEQPASPSPTAPDGARDNPVTQPPPEPSEFGDDTFRVMVGGTVILVVLLVAGMVVAVRRQPSDSDVHASLDEGGGPSAQAPEHILARAAELGLAEIGDLAREPRQAIIACYAAMERALANAPDAVPQDSDTPTEVLARAVEHHALHAGTATELVELFAEARFSTHVMTEEHRAAAVRVLQLVLGELRAGELSGSTQGAGA